MRSCHDLAICWVRHPSRPIDGEQLFMSFRDSFLKEIHIAYRQLLDDSPGLTYKNVIARHLSDGNAKFPLFLAGVGIKPFVSGDPSSRSTLSLSYVRCLHRLVRL